MSDPVRAAFEAWFASVYGPPPSDAQILASLADAARLEAFMGGAWAAWQALHPQIAIVDTLTRERIINTPIDANWSTSADEQAATAMAEQAAYLRKRVGLPHVERPIGLYATGEGSTVTGLGEFIPETL